MRVTTLLVALLCLALTPAVAVAQDAATLRREIEQLQKQLQSVTERLQRLEAQPPAPAAPAPGAPAPTATAPSTAPPSAIDVLRPRQPFALYQQRGSGQLLFDMGIAGDFVGNITSGNVERAGGGTFAGQENRFFPREVELSLFGQIDPYASAVVRIEAGRRDRREPGRGAPDAPHAAVRHPGEARPDAQPLRLFQRSSRARSALGRPPQRHAELPRRRRVARKGYRGHSRSRSALLHRGARRHFQRRQRDRVRPHEPAPSPRHRPAPHVLRVRRRARPAGGHVGGERPDRREEPIDDPGLGGPVQIPSGRLAPSACHAHGRGALLDAQDRRRRRPER